MEAVRMVWRTAWWEGPYPRPSGPAGFIPREVVVARTALAVAFFLSLWAVVLCILKACRPGAREICGTSASVWAHKSMILFHHITSSIWSWTAILQDSALLKILTFRGGVLEANAMLTGTTSLEGPLASCEFLIPYSIAYMVSDLLLFGLWNRRDPEMPIFIVHHVFSIISWAEGLRYDWGVRYALYLIGTEVSGIFMVVRWMLAQAKLKSTVAYLANGILFTVLYILVRFFPGLAIVRSTVLYPPLLDPYRDPSSPYVRSLTHFGCVVLYVPVLLNTYWTFKVAKGFSSAVREELDKGKKGS